MPRDLVPRIGGANQWSGDNSFNQLYVRNLWVQENLTLYDADSDVSAGASAQFGTEDPQDFWLKSAGIARLGVTSAGVYLFTSSQPSSVFASTLLSDDFNRADANPATGWARQAGTASSIQTSANVAVPQNTSLVIYSLPTAGAWATGSSQDAQVAVQLSSTQTYRAGLCLLAASSGPSSYVVYVQSNTVNFHKTAASGSNIGLANLGTIVNTGASAGTLRVHASANGASIVLSAFVNGAFIGSKADTGAGRYAAGYAGLVFGMNAGGNPASGGTLNNFQQNSAAAPPFAAGDLVLQASASLWGMVGTNQATKHAQVFTDGLQLGFGAPVVFTGLTSAFVSAGTSAYFNTATYGVVRLASAVGTPGLSGVVGFSATGGVQPSAVGNDLVWLANNTYGISAQGSPVSGASGVVQVSGGTGITVSAVGANLLLVSGATLSPSATWAASAGIATSALWASAAASATWATTASTATSATWASTSLSATNWAAAAASASASWFYPGTVDAPGLRPTADGTSGTGFWSPGAGSLAFSTSGVERLRITSAGNVGIGTENPGHKFDVSTSGSFTIRAGGSPSPRLTLQSNTAGVKRWNIDNFEGRFRLFHEEQDGSLGAEILTVLNTGNVGIRTATPGTALTIEGTAPIEEIRSGGFLMLRDTANNWDMRLQAFAIQKLGIFSGGDLVNPIAAFVHGGNVGIGTTAPKETLHVAGTFQLNAVASANLPAASATRDGMIILDLTASAMVYYVNGKRISAAVGGAF